MQFFWVISAAGAAMATVTLTASGVLLWRLVLRLQPLLRDTHVEVRALSDQTSGILVQADATLALVEQRVTAGMTRAGEGSRDIAGQAMRVGGILAGLFVALRVMQRLRGAHAQPGRRRRRRRGRR